MGELSYREDLQKWQGSGASHGPGAETSGLSLDPNLLTLAASAGTTVVTLLVTEG
ncbi:hypothetical protein MMF93_21425 [Streptomyces tubbatahanensis]|uniref:Uncharacterized protein n=1 Tax=Streptomyces tubbatahanensis TaxID=2923272 RepID=A0ABY3XW65_9ACTN|nr:hypothetical protein [Streptomyces tubbatahanensis]UNS98734.1 hypothetical protein MMF93_21425 [Streptomyces tubbatahanensis]